MIRVYYIYFQKNRDKKYGNIYILLKKKDNYNNLCIN